MFNINMNMTWKIVYVMLSHNYSFDMFFHLFSITSSENPQTNHLRKGGQNAIESSLEGKYGTLGV